MKVSRRAIERVSGASTLSVFAGLAALAVLAVPSGVPHLVKLAAPGPAGAATAAPQSSMQAAPLQASSAVKVVRTKSVSIPIEKEEASGNSPEIIAVAARTGRKLGTTGEAVPETTWDGQPHKTITPSPPAAAPAQPAVAPVAVPSATPPKKGDSPAKAAPAVPVQPGAADASLAPVVEEWTAAEVAGALKECLKLMGPVDAEIEPIEAMKKGPCGAAAPIRLKSVGSGNSKVEFAPPVEINCQLAVKLSDWVAKSLQPAAAEMLSSRVVRIGGASGYQCRNRYGLANAPLSEHALANAVDIPSFTLADGRSIRLISSWGPTARDLAPKVAPPDAATVASGAPAATGPAKTSRTEAAAVDQKPPPDSKPAKDATGKKSGKQVAAAETTVTPALKGASRQQLGAPKPLATPISATGPPGIEKRNTPEARFLRRISDGACATFGTVLGPEANEAHRDHFHFDMKERKRAAYCQ